MKSSDKVVIVGAGIAGLTLGYRLSRDGFNVVLVEKCDEVGGLARSLRSGDVVFDIGPHRFHSDLAEVNGLVDEVLADDEISISRKSGVHMFGTYFDWPLDLRALTKLPARYLLPVACDILRKKDKGSGNFEDYIIGKYGQTLYEVFFRPYTEKFLLTSCPDISRDWAITGIDRAVIDKKAQFDDLLSLARNLLSKTPETRFVYPASGGIQVFCDKLADKIRANGGRILTGTEVERVQHGSGAVTGVIVDGEEYPCDRLVWTAPINNILTLLGEDPADLNYLSLVLYNYRVKETPRLDFQWCYYGAADVPFNRISQPTLFNPALAPEKESGICVEVTCMKDDDAWHEPERREEAIRRSLVSCGAVSSADVIRDCVIARVENAYPIYALGYRSILDSAMEKIGRFQNVRLLGRTGAFWYNNMDHSIEAALRYHSELVKAPALPDARHQERDQKAGILAPAPYAPPLPVPT